MGPATVIAPVLFPCGALTWNGSDCGEGRWFSGGRRYHICMEKGGWSSIKTTTCLWWLAETWGGERGGFYAHSTPKPCKTRGFCIRRTSRNMSSAITACRTNTKSAIRRSSDATSESEAVDMFRFLAFVLASQCRHILADESWQAHTGIVGRWCSVL